MKCNVNKMLPFVLPFVFVNYPQQFEFFWPTEKMARLSWQKSVMPGSLSPPPVSLSLFLITQSSHCTHAYLTADEAFPLNIFSPTQMSVIQHTQPDAILWKGARGLFQKQALNGSQQVHLSRAWLMWCHCLFLKPHAGRWKNREGISSHKICMAASTLLKTDCGISCGCFAPQ